MYSCIYSKTLTDNSKGKSKKQSYWSEVLDKKLHIPNNEYREVSKYMEYPRSPYTSCTTVEPCKEYSSKDKSEKCEPEYPPREPRSEYRNMVE